MNATQWSAFDFTRDGVKLHCHVQGTGAPLLLLHGISDNGLCWGRTADALAQHYTVYAPDLRGHGASDAPSSGYTFEDNAADAAELLRGRGHASAIVLGHSFGARTGMALAATFPHAVSRLILVDPPMFDIPADVPPDVLGSERYAWFEWLRNYQKMSRAELMAQCHTESPQWSDAEVAAWAESKLQANPRLWQRAGIPMPGDWRATLEKITCPTLLVYGDTERGGLIDLTLAEQAVARLANGQAAHVANAGHSIHRDEFAAFMAEVNAFLQTT